MTLRSTCGVPMLALACPLVGALLVKVVPPPSARELVAPPMPKERFLELLRQRMTRPRGASPKEAMHAGGKPVGRVA